MQQGREIEKFIETCMTTLFQLCKSELAMNLALRKALLIERKSRTSFENALHPSYTTFLRTLSDASGFEISTLESATKFILKLIRDSKMRKPSNREFDEERLQFSLDIANATARAEKAEKQNQALQNRLFLLQNELAAASAPSMIHKKKNRYTSATIKLSKTSKKFKN
jgi:hypothetical protein